MYSVLDSRIRIATWREKNGRSGYEKTGRLVYRVSAIIHRNYKFTLTICQHNSRTRIKTWDAGIPGLSVNTFSFYFYFTRYSWLQLVKIYSLHHYYHHHFSLTKSTAGHRPPLVPSTDDVVSAISNDISPPRPDRRSIEWEVIQRSFIVLAHTWSSL